VSGAFVSLKRGKHLRSCCGMLGQPVTLAAALQHATGRTVFEDTRFPPVSPTEIDHLDLEVWLLYSPTPVAARGEERAEAITIGRHGIQVVRGTAHGLFLPSVATDHDWDARRFLDQVCLKAGLPPTAWKEEDARLVTFEGEMLRGRVAGAEGIVHSVRRAGVCRAEDVPAYAEFCRRNVAALLSGATPSYYFFGAPDGNVNGAVLTVRQTGSADGLHFSQLSLRPGVPLQATLFALAQSAAQALANRGARADALAGLRFDLMLLHDPTLHGTVSDPALDGLDPRHRAIFVTERNKSALLFDPERTAEELLREAAAQARVDRPRSAAVFGLETLATTAPLSIASVPRPVRGPAVRPAGVAGKFYPADPGELARMVDALMGDDRPEVRDWPAAMVPHAGLRFSGSIAAAVLKRIRIPRTVLVLGPKHTSLGMEWAVAPHQTWELPGASMESDFLLARQLSQAIPGLEMDAAAHRQEHAIEVELPFIARLAPESRVVGIALGAGDLESCRRFAEGLAGVLRERKDRPLLLISSDMNHFATDAENRRLDALALSALERLDPEEVYETVTGNHISMCGILPAVIVLETLRLLGGVQKAERVGYATSADVSGDTSRVVGYAGMLFGG
jgi:AmmeMemoRadiSam system protein B/AmmeMemoRadiSam system protein A